MPLGPPVSRPFPLTSAATTGRRIGIGGPSRLVPAVRDRTLRPRRRRGRTADRTPGACGAPFRSPDSACGPPGRRPRSPSATRRSRRGRRSVRPRSRRDRTRGRRRPGTRRPSPPTRLSRRR
ncbi:hypothetical protein DV707_10050 [Halobellus limi]|uniref:Uncharacterized protein n=1 Tax=Halobellus limi TaxID=699433 RepID=A0A4D6H294_9EURY|nr:hypothetical protein DV707_10050 [Halobellus limi]